MALQICTECKTAYAPAGECPTCGENHWVDETEAEARGWYSTNGDSLAPADETEATDESAAVAEPAEDGSEPEGEGKATPDDPEPASDSPSHTGEVDHAEVRAWAQDQGLQVADSGPVPGWVIDQYQQQHQ